MENKKNAINHLYVLGPCWPGAGLVVSLGLATFLWVPPSEKPTQIWPRYYSVVEKHHENKRGRERGETVVQRCWGEERSGWITHVNDALCQQLHAPRGRFSHSCFCGMAHGTQNFNSPSPSSAPILPVGAGGHPGLCGG